MNPLHDLIRRLPAGVEFLVVVTWAFGLPICASILSIGNAEFAGVQRTYHDAAIVSVLLWELAQSLFLVWFLRIRGWTLEKLGLNVTLRGTIYGLVLLVCTYGLLIGVRFLAGQLLPELQAAADRFPRPAPDVNLNLLYLASVASGIFEEVFVAGYVIAALTPVRGMWMAINVSTGIRLLCHLYEGSLGILTAVPLGLLYGYVYSRTRMLWPLILAHIAIDLIGLSIVGR